MTTHYSQHGEDLVLDAIFEGQAAGTFAEIGCIDGKRFSNTLFLEERGWKGLCVEAHPDYIDSLRTNRPGSIVSFSAVTANDGGEIEFHANWRASLSTIDPKMREVYTERYTKFPARYEVIQVPARSLSSLLDESGLGSLDLLSIDVEGTELDALAGLELPRHLPRVLVIESDNNEVTHQIDSLLLPHGCVRGLQISNNVIYFRDRSDFDRIAGRTIAGDCKWVQHPLDNSGDTVRQFSVAVPPHPLASSECDPSSRAIRSG